jgi:hypothetical protein
MKNLPFYFKDESILNEINQLPALYSEYQSFEEVNEENRNTYYSAVITFSNALIEVTTNILVKLSSYPELIEKYIDIAGAENVGEQIQAEIFSYITGGSIENSIELVRMQNALTVRVIGILDEQKVSSRN